MERRIDVNYKTIFFIAAFIALLWILYQIREVIVILFVSIILMSALSPIVALIEKTKIPKVFAVTIAYLLALALIAGIISFTVTPFVTETASLITNIPKTLDQVFPDTGLIDRNVLQQELGNFSANVLDISLALFNNILALISIAVLTFYLLLERQNLDHLIVQFTPGKEDRIKKITKKIEEKLGSWLRGQLALSLIIGTLVYIVLFILQIPYALPLAILAGILEIVPVIGPIISAIPAVIIAFTVAPITALFVGIAYFVIQQLENHLIVPQVMKKAVGLNPLIVILAVAIGGKLLGFSGALLAVPIAVVIQIITEGSLKEEI